MNEFNQLLIAALALAGAVGFLAATIWAPSPWLLLAAAGCLALVFAALS